MRTLAVAYANTGRIDEARSALDSATKGWPPIMKNLKFVMYLFPSTDRQALESWADGYLLAGIPGEPSGYYKILKENKLTGKEIRKLVIGHRIAGKAFMTGEQWWVERSLDGKSIIRIGEKSDTGKSWIEENMICDQWDNFFEGLKDCWTIYHNPDGKISNNNEFLGVPDYGIYPFSQIKQE